ncbi:glutamate--cysteine ligase [Nocardioides sp. C4-1]|uniref:carboxylate-amine ligase n=1 Tax=Nocardioides sp. C4-1 TaxID=3151851 RepID=UPI003266FC8A
MRTVGVEEELWVVDPATRCGVARADDVLRAAGGSAEKELFRHQVEIMSRPSTAVDEVVAQLHHERTTALHGADRVGLSLVASPVVVQKAAADDDRRVSDDDRYRDMVERFGAVTEDAGTCGMHVHVGIADPDEGVRVIDRIAPWLPVVLALSASSPFAHGRDTGYASWRSELWSHWPSAGPTVPFGDAASYRAVAQALVASGAARDEHMLYFDARLARDYPTVEVRVADVMADLDDVRAVVALVRGLVEAAAHGALPAATWRVELLRAARWRAARHGLHGRLLHPCRPGAEPVGAAAVLEDLLACCSPYLDEAGDLALVEDGVQRLLGATGAVRQRAVHSRSGSLDDVVDDLRRRTAAPPSGSAQR